MRNLPCKPADNKKFTFVRYADDWLAGVCGTKAECEDLKAEIAEFLSTELKLTLSEEKTRITHSSEKVRFNVLEYSYILCQLVPIHTICVWNSVNTRNQSNRDP